MILDYSEIIKLVRIRKKQIEAAALEIEKYNIEFVKLSSIELLLADLIVNERKGLEDETTNNV